MNLHESIVFHSLVLVSEQRISWLLGVIYTVPFPIQTHAAIPPREYPDPSEPGSQARSGPASTRVGDHLGSPGAACFVLNLEDFYFTFLSVFFVCFVLTFELSYGLLWQLLFLFIVVYDMCIVKRICSRIVWIRFWTCLLFTFFLNLEVAKPNGNDFLTAIWVALCG